jgi:DNA-binding CsgD family transcriptional regulator
MPRLSKRTLEGIHELESELLTLREGPTIRRWLNGSLRELLGAEAAGNYTLEPHGTGLRLGEFRVLGVDEAGFARVFDPLIRSQPTAWACYNPIRPDPEQRNRALRLRDLPEKLREATVLRELYPRFGLHKRDQLRVVVCEGPSLLAWVGAFREEPFTKTERRILQRLIPALQRRLSLERLVAGDADAIVRVALEEIPGAALVAGADGQVEHANSAGRALLDRRPSQTAAELREAIRKGAPCFRVTPIVGMGGRARYLAVRRDEANEGAARARTAAIRWGLTRRQEDVLRHVLTGHANRTIAAILGVAEKTIEEHVTALLEKAQVESRSALAAKVWTG